MTDEHKHKLVMKPRSSGATSLAKAEIDSRLAQAIRDRAKASQQVSRLVHWQDRLARLEQEINSLIGFQQRLNGHTGMTIPRNEEEFRRLSTGLETPTPYPGHAAPIPEGVTSIPSRQPKPTSPNQADFVGGEGGFS